MNSTVKAKMAKRDKELSKYNKNRLWEILESKNKIICRDNGYLKNWLITDIMIIEFGTWDVTKFYN